MAGVSREDILQLLKTKGPLVPNDIKKVLGGDTLILGAILSELSSRKLVKLTHLKRGGSPFYYLPGQEPDLERCIQYLAPKDSSVVEFLREQQVVEDKKLELPQRVALRQLKDFAKELKARTSQGEILFWRYYMLSEENAIKLLNQRHAPQKKSVQESSQQTTQQESQTQSKTLPLTPSQEEPINQPPQSNDQKEGVPSQNTSESSPKEQLVETKKSVEPVQNSTDAENTSQNQPVESTKDSSSSQIQPKEHITQEKTSQESTPQPLEEEKKTPQETTNQKETPDEKTTNAITPQETPSTKPKEENKSDNKDETDEENDEQKTIIQEPSLEQTPFYQEVLAFFDTHNIAMLEENQVTKNKEYDFIVTVPSAVGDLIMVARAKNKKRLNEADVAPALLKAKTEDLPCLFLTPGQFTKKSQAIIKKEYKGLLIKKL